MNLIDILNIVSDGSESPRLRFLAFENVEAGVWSVFDSETEKIFSIPFGGVVQALYNTYYLVAAAPDDTDREKPPMDFQTEADFVAFRKLSKDLVKDFQPLISLFKNWAAVKAGLAENPVGTTDDLFSMWKIYRFAAFSGTWSADSFDESRDLQMQKIFQRKFCVPVDYLHWTDGSGTAHVSRTFALSDVAHLFPEDLFKVVVSRTVAAPVVCRKCGRLYFSNHKKIAFCPDCQPKTDKAFWNQRRHEVRVRYLHKKVLDYCTYHKINSETFRVRSNSIWAEVKAGTKSEADYIEWLQECLSDFKKEGGKEGKKK